MREATAPVDAGALVPHTSVARLIRRIDRIVADGCLATGDVPARHPLATGGWAPAFLAIELGAQAAAALETLQRRAAGDSPGAVLPGSLVRVRHARFLADRLPVDTPLSVQLRLDGAAPPLAMYAMTVAEGDRPLVEALIATYVPGGGAR